jgi:hypothetical protein
MILEYTNKFDVTTCSNCLENMDKKCSELMFEIHGLLDLKNTPIKNAVKLLGVTSSQAKRLAKVILTTLAYLNCKHFLHDSTMLNHDFTGLTDSTEQ